MLIQQQQNVLSYLKIILNQVCTYISNYNHIKCHGKCFSSKLENVIQGSS